MSHVALNIGAWQINMRIKQKNLDESMGRRGVVRKGGQKRLFLDKQDAFLHNQGQRPYRCAYCSGWHLASYKVHKARFHQTMAL